MFLDFSFDVNNHIIWAKDAYNHGLRGFYDTPSSEVYATPFPNYPPLSIFLFYPLYPIYLVLHELVWRLNLALPIFPSGIMLFIEQRVFLAGLFKIPAIIFDFILAYVIYLLSKKKAAIALVLFNPILFYISAFWGQIDVIPITLAIVAFYLALKTQLSSLSLLMFSLGLLVKPTTLIYLPIYLLFLIKNFGFVKTVKAAFLVNLLFWLSFLPFYQSGNFWLFPYSVFLNKILATQSIQYVNNSALNTWLLLPKIAVLKDTVGAWLGLTFRHWGYLITVGFFGLVLVRLRRQKLTSLAAFWTLYLTSFAAFLFLTRMHERYILLVWPLLTILVLKDRKLWPAYLTFNLIGFLNIYKSFSVPRVEMVMQLFESALFKGFLSGINLGLFFHSLRRFWQRLA